MLLEFGNAKKDWCELAVPPPDLMSRVDMKQAKYMTVSSHIRF